MYKRQRYVLEGDEAPLLELREHLRDRIGRLRSRRVKRAPIGQGERTFVLAELQPDWRDQRYFLDYTEEYVDGLDYGAVKSLRTERGRKVYGSIPLGLQYLRFQICTANLDLQAEMGGLERLIGRYSAETELNAPFPSFAGKRFLVPPLAASIFFLSLLSSR